MGENSRMFKRVTAFVLTLVMALSLVVASPATTAEAASSYAKKLTLTRSGKTVTALTVTAGSSKSIQAKITAKGTVSKTVTAKTNRTSIATAKVVNKKYVKITGKKAGKTYLTVTTKAKNAKGKVLSKKILVTVKAAAAKQTIALAVKEATIAVKGTATIEPTVAPAGSTVTYTSSDATVATVDAKGVVTGVKAGVAEITCANGTATATFTVTVKDVILKEVKQVKMNELEAVVEGDLAKVTKDSFKIVSTDETKTIYVNKITKDEKTGKVTIVTYANMSDGKEYGLTLDGTTLTFKATDGTVAGVNVTPLTVVNGKETEIKAQIVDANGIVINETVYGTAMANVDFSITTTKGYTTGSKLVLPSVGDTAEATVTYHTYKYDASANEIGKIEQKFTIKAVDSTATVSNFRYTIADSAPDWAKTVDVKTAFSLSKASVNAYFYIVDSEGTDVTSNYKVESGDPNIVLLPSQAIGSKAAAVTIKPVQEGKTVLNITDGDGKIVTSLPIEVTAKQTLKTVKADKASYNVSVVAGDEKTFSIGLKGYDQNGDEMDLTTYEAKVLNEVKNATYFVKGDIVFGGYADKKIPVTSTETQKGSYTIQLIGVNGDQKSAPITVTVNAVDTASIKATYEIELSSAEVDMVINKDTKPSTVNVNLVSYKNGAKVGVVTGANLTFTLKKNATGNSLVGTKGTYTQADGTLAIPVVTTTAATTYQKELDVANYEIVAEYTDGNVTVKRTATLKVTDSQPAMEITKFANGKDGLTKSGATVTAQAISLIVAAAPECTYDGKEVKATGDTNTPVYTLGDITVSADDVVVNGTQYFVKKATATLTYQGKTFTVPVAVNTSFTNVQ